MRSSAQLLTLRRKMFNGNFFNSPRVVGSATFPPLTANFNAGRREREEEREGDKWRNVLRSRPTDRPVPTRPPGREGRGRGRECTHEVAKCKYAFVNEWLVGRTDGGPDGCMDGWVDG